jgi:hypothetical protein
VETLVPRERLDYRVSQVYEETQVSKVPPVKQERRE